MRAARRLAAAVVVSAVAALTALTAPVASAAGDPDVAAWKRNGRPDRLVVLRPHGLTTLNHGAVVRRLYTGTGSVSLGWLAANTGTGWIGYEPGSSTTVRIRAAVLLAPGTALSIDGTTEKVLMTAGEKAASGSWISGSRATLNIRDTALTSVGPKGKSPASADAAGRPYLSMGGAGRMDLRHVTVTGFGRGGRSAAAGHSGVTWGRGSTGSVTGSEFVGNHTGMRLAGSNGVVLNGVTAERSTEDGIVLKGDRSTTTSGLTAQSNGRSGVVVSGTDDRILSDIVTHDNESAGIKATDQRRLRLVAPVSHADRGGGIKLISCELCTVRKATVEGPTRAGVSVSGTGSDVRVEEPELTGGGGGAGILLKAGIDGATVTGGTVGGFDRGIGITGTGVRVAGTSLTGNRTGLTVGGYADRITLDRIAVGGGRNGITAFATARHITLTGVRIRGVARKGLISASPGLRVTGGSVSGAPTAVDLGAPALLRGLAVDGSQRGIHLANGVHADGRHLDVLSERRGVEADSGARLDLTDSRVRAPFALTGSGDVARHGHTKVSLPPFPWLGFAALAALLVAVLLQTIHHVRQRGTPRPAVAAHVRNTA